MVYICLVLLVTGGLTLLVGIAGALGGALDLLSAGLAIDRVPLLALVSVVSCYVTFLSMVHFILKLAYCKSLPTALEAGCPLASFILVVALSDGTTRNMMKATELLPAGGMAGDSMKGVLEVLVHIGHTLMGMTIPFQLIALIVTMITFMGGHWGGKWVWKD